MTISAHLKVESVQRLEAGNWKVTAGAHVDTPYTGQRWNGEYENDDPTQGKPVYEPVELPSINSNTEGRITAISVEFYLDGESLPSAGPGLEIGTLINLTSHFQSAVKNPDPGEAAPVRVDVERSE